MSDFLKDNPLLQWLLLMVMLIIFFFAVSKPYIDKGDADSYDYIMHEMVPRLDTIMMNQEESNNLLRENLK